MEIQYLQFNEIPEPKIVDNMIELHNSIFDSSGNLREKMKRMPMLLINVATEGTKVIGYKIGYELEEDKFYSWLGGVDQKYRNNGVASSLMEKQHQFLKENGYKIVQTKTKNIWRHMLILNLKNGFDVIGTYTDEKGEPKIILEKKLIP